ncbi:MAG: DUF72 domain-containing protein [Opitutaceae bacterium]
MDVPARVSPDARGEDASGLIYTHANQARGMISVGCGSWADKEYVGILYPPDLPAKDRLKTYATWFDHVEVNSTYYASPRASVVEGWVKQTPAAFTFDIKLHRAFSQNPRKAAAEGGLVEALLEGVQPLADAQKLGAFLLVLAPYFSPKRNRLEELDALIEKLRPYVLAVELRHSDWVNGKTRDSTLEFFRDCGLSWVAVDMPDVEGSTIMPAVDEVTNPKLAYMRLHGRNKHWLEAASAAERHIYAYNEKELAELSARAQRLAGEAECVRVVANNHAQDFAPKTALALKDLLGQETKHS